MMENRLPLTSPDVSSNRNILERCPRPLYSRDSSQQHHQIPRRYQGKNLINVKEEEEEMYVTGDEQWKEEKVSTEISTDGSSNRNTPERCPSPLYSRDYTQEHHNIPQDDQTGGGPSKELVLLEYERELMTVLQDEIFSGLGGEYDLDLPEDAGAGSPQASNGGHDARYSAFDHTVHFYSAHEEEAEEALDQKELKPSHYDKSADIGDVPGPEETLPLHSEAVKLEMSPAPALLWTGTSSLSRRPQPVSPLVHSPSAVTPETSTIPVAFSPKPERRESSPSHTAASPSPQPYREELELQRQQLLAHRRTHRVMEVQVRQQRRHYMAVERALNALVQQQRALTQEMAGIHSVLRQAVTIMGESRPHAEPRGRGQRAGQAHASNPAPTSHARRGRPRGANSSRPC